MEKKFQSLTEVISFIRAVPDTADFNQKIYNEFNVQGDVTPLQAKYIWQYMVQGSFLGKTRQELIDYAIAGANKIVKQFKFENIGLVEASALSIRRGRKVIHQKYNDGNIVLNRETGKYEGWFGGRVVSIGQTAKKVRTKIVKMKVMVGNTDKIKIVVPELKKELKIEGRKTLRNKIRLAMKK